MDRPRDHVHVSASVVWCPSLLAYCRAVCSSASTPELIIIGSREDVSSALPFPPISLSFSNARWPAHPCSLGLAGSRRSDETHTRKPDIIGRRLWFWCWSENRTTQNWNCGFFLQTEPKPTDLGHCETVTKLDGKLCQEYSHQKLLESDKFCSSYNWKCRWCFLDTVYSKFPPELTNLWLRLLGDMRSWLRWGWGWLLLLTNCTGRRYRRTVCRCCLLFCPSCASHYITSGSSSPQNLGGWHGPMASAVVRAYNEGLGAEPPAGSRGRAPGQGVRRQNPPEAQAFLAFGRLM